MADYAAILKALRPLLAHVGNTLADTADRPGAFQYGRDLSGLPQIDTRMMPGGAVAYGIPGKRGALTMTRDPAGLNYRGTYSFLGDDRPVRINTTDGMYSKDAASKAGVQANWGGPLYAQAYSDIDDAGLKNVASALSDINTSRRTSNMLSHYARNAGDPSGVIISPEQGILSGRLGNMPYMDPETFHTQLDPLEQLGALGLTESDRTHGALNTLERYRGMMDPDTPAFSMPPLSTASSDAYAQLAAQAHAGGSSQTPFGAATLRRANLVNGLETGDTLPQDMDDYTASLFRARGGRVAQLVNRYIT